MEVLVCENNSSGTSSLRLVTNCVGKFFTGINIARQCVWENHLDELSPQKRRSVLSRNYSEQSTEKQNGVKTRTIPQKRKHLPYMGVIVVSTKKERLSR